MIVRFAPALLLYAALSCPVFAETPGKSGNWPSFRGPSAAGVADGFPAPVSWNVEASKGVRWKTPIPGLGHSSPIVWGDRVFITSAISGRADAKLKVGLYGDIAPVEDDTSHAYMVYCLDKKTGKILWERTAYKGVPKVKRHTKSTHANPTMATDGNHVIASFGSEGLYCYDPSGRLLWKKDLGVLDSGFYMVPGAQWGFASSPIIDDGKIYVQCDVQKDSFLAALDVKDGHEIWRTKRDDVPTWSTPAVCKAGNRKILIVNGYKHIGGYDAASGKEVWRLIGGGDIPVPTPIIAGDLIFITNAHGRMAPIYAIKTTANGDISLTGDQTSNDNIVWFKHREGGYMQTPLVYGDYLYVCRDNGVLNCYAVKTGQSIYNERLGTGRTGFTASGVAADGKLYYTSEEGEIYVVKAGPNFELLATNSMGEICMATPAISEGSLIFRTQSHVVAVADGNRKQR